MTFTEVTFKPRRKIVLKASKRSAKRRKVVETIRDTFRRYNLPEWMIKQGKNALRYKAPLEKGIYWWHFSLHVRKRDVEQWGTCISCDRPITVDTCDAGHFIPAGSCGRDLLFDERNVNAECSYCNAWDGMHLFGYARNLDKRYGAGTADELLRRYYEYKASEPTRDWSRAEYEQKIQELL